MHSRSNSNYDGTHFSDVVHTVVCPSDGSLAPPFFRCTPHVPELRAVCGCLLILPNAFSLLHDNRVFGGPECLGGPEGYRDECTVVELPLDPGRRGAAPVGALGTISGLSEVAIGTRGATLGDLPDVFGDATLPDPPIGGSTFPCALNTAPPRSLSSTITEPFRPGAGGEKSVDRLRLEQMSPLEVLRGFEPLIGPTLALAVRLPLRELVVPGPGLQVPTAFELTPLSGLGVMDIPEKLLGSSRPERKSLMATSIARSLASSSFSQSSNSLPM